MIHSVTVWVEIKSIDLFLTLCDRHVMETAKKELSFSAKLKMHNFVLQNLIKYCI